MAHIKNEAFDQMFRPPPNHVDPRNLTDISQSVTSNHLDGIIQYAAEEFHQDLVSQTTFRRPS